MRIALALALTLALAAPLATAQEAAPPAEEGSDLMERGARLLFDGLVQQMSPALDEMAAAMADAEPALRAVLGLMGDIRHYQPPERLPNGDILIRRKPGAPPPPALPPASDAVPGEIEL